MSIVQVCHLCHRLLAKFRYQTKIFWPTIWKIQLNIPNFIVKNALSLALDVPKGHQSFIHEMFAFFSFLNGGFGDPLSQLWTLRNTVKASREEDIQSRLVLQPVHFVLWSISGAGILLNRDAGPDARFFRTKNLKNTGKNKSVIWIRNDLCRIRILS